jgi:hypothetical protein
MTWTLFYALYCLEAGFFFTVVPWTRIWTQNSLLHSNVLLAAFADNPYARGFVSGVGILHLLIGAREFLRMLNSRREGGRS